VCLGVRAEVDAGPPCVRLHRGDVRFQDVQID
jgi:hypothetical protein